MSSLTINLEIGHDSSLRTKTTPEGFTHDWEVFVRGSNGADIRNYVDRVVFHLHETFEKPKRVVKEPPYSLRTSGYAGFNLPIHVYLKNSQEPKKIQFNYDLQLQPSGPPIHKVQKEKYTFHSVNDDFRNKLLKGGATLGLGSNAENPSNYSVKAEDKPQMTSKPKFGGDQPKKYKLKPEESRGDQFTDLFGTPITKTSRVQEAPKIKETLKPVVKPSDKEKVDKISDKEKSKTKNPHKDKERDRDKDKEKEKSKDREKQSDTSGAGEKKFKDDKKDKKDKKDRETSKRDKKDRKEREKEKEKEKERDKSPAIRVKSPSPKRSPKRVRSPSPARNTNKDREQPKEKDSRESKDKEREKEKKSKKHKEKDSKHRDKEKDREKEKDKDKSGDHSKEHKNKESKSGKEKENNTSSNSNSTTSREKERDVVSPINNPQTQKLEKKDKNKDREVREPDKPEETKSKKEEKEKSEDKPKHKHKKKDKDRKEKKDKEDKSHKKEKEEKKQEKEKAILNVSKESGKQDLSAKEREKTDTLFGSSPRSEPPSSPPPVEILPEKTVPAPVPDDDSSNGSKLSSREPSPVQQLPPQTASTFKSPTPSPVQELLKKAPQEETSSSKKGSRGDASATTTSKKRDKKDKKKDKKNEKDHEKKRKRKVEAETQVEIEEPPAKVEKKEEDTNNNSDDERKVSSTEDANPIPYKDDAEAYMSMLRELQHKIMGLKDNSDLQKVVQLIAETGRYEVSAHTFDFDLCLLDRSTVMQLQAFFNSV